MTKSGEYAVAVKVHVSEETAARLKAVAMREDRSVNYILRRIIDDGLAMDDVNQSNLETP